MTPLIDPEFRALIPPLSPEELAQLETNIVADGCRDPLVVWSQRPDPEADCSDCECEEPQWELEEDREIEAEYRDGSLNWHCTKCGAWSFDGVSILLDGHNRVDICERLSIPFTTTQLEFADREAAIEWIILNQFGRRNLTTYARAELALKLEPIFAKRAKENQKQSQGAGKKGLTKSANLSEVHVRKEVARVAGVAPDTIAKAKLVATHASEETKKDLRTSKDKSLNRVAKEIKETNQREARKEKRSEAAKSAPATDTRIIVGDFRKHADKIADGSLSLIFTDPPYDRQASKLLPDLAAFAAEKLADGGSLICYVGQTQLPAAMDAFRLHLRYWWTIACVHSGRATVMREYGINAGWKAVLWFVKGTRDNNSIMVNDVMSGGEEKSLHDWQQAESEASYWIEKLCPQDGWVCDPFLGSGTTAAAAEKLQRAWIGFELNADHAATARSASPPDGNDSTSWRM